MELETLKLRLRQKFEMIAHTITVSAKKESKEIRQNA
jgi:hypothetical protein